MKNALLVASILLASQSSLASLIKKAGEIRLNGETQKVEIDARQGSGRIVVGGVEFKVSSTSSKEVDGARTVRLGGQVIEDKRLQILFRQVGANEVKEVKEVVQNASEVVCDSKSNAVLLLSDELAGTFVGNCLTLE